jgi:hypothetical protein
MCVCVCVSVDRADLTTTHGSRPSGTNFCLEPNEIVNRAKPARDCLRAWPGVCKCSPRTRRAGTPNALPPRKSFFFYSFPSRPDVSYLTIAIFSGCPASLLLRVEEINNDRLRGFEKVPRCDVTHGAALEIPRDVTPFPSDHIDRPLNI